LKFKFTFALLFACLLSFGQKARIFAGPIVGSVTNTSAKVWIGYYGRGKQILVLTDTISNRIFYPSSVSEIRSKKGTSCCCCKFHTISTQPKILCSSLDRERKEKRHGFLQHIAGFRHSRFFVYTWFLCIVGNRNFGEVRFPVALLGIFCKWKRRVPISWFGWATISITSSAIMFRTKRCSRAT
jgi:hypothetical protein